MRKEARKKRRRKKKAVLPWTFERRMEEGVGGREGEGG
jgi:hypothetical protein